MGLVHSVAIDLAARLLQRSGYRVLHAWGEHYMPGRLLAHAEVLEEAHPFVLPLAFPEELEEAPVRRTATLNPLLPRDDAAELRALEIRACPGCPCRWEAHLDGAATAIDSAPAVAQVIHITVGLTSPADNPESRSVVRFFTVVPRDALRGDWLRSEVQGALTQRIHDVLYANYPDTHPREASAMFLQYYTAAHLATTTDPAPHARVGDLVVYSHESNTRQLQIHRCGCEMWPDHVGARAEVLEHLVLWGGEISPALYVPWRVPAAAAA